MNSKKRAIVYVLLGIICLVPLVGQTQDATPIVSEPVQKATESAVNQALTYIDSVLGVTGGHSSHSPECADIS